MSYQYFCFLDVLGYKEYIDKDMREGTNIFKDKLITSFRIFEKINASDVKWKSISDSIFISVGTQYEISKFFELIRNIWLEFLANGLLLRGGISFDEHFENNNITYSKVLVDAHSLENETAFFPRIVIKDTIIEMEKEKGKINELVSEDLIIKSGDDYIIDTFPNERKDEIYEHLKEIVKSQKGIIYKNANVRAKHLWLQDFIQYKYPYFKKYLIEWNKSI
jgi:hypothetical protein